MTTLVDTIGKFSSLPPVAATTEIGIAVNQLKTYIDDNFGVAADERITLATAIDNNTQLIQQVANSNSSNYQDLTELINDLGLLLNTNISLLQQQISEISTESQSLVSSVASLSSTVGNNQSSLNTQITLLTDKTSALAQSLTELTVKVDNNESIVGTFSDQINLAVTENTALAQRLTELTTKVNNNESSFTDEIKLFTDETSSLSQRITDLAAKTYTDVAVVRAQIRDESTARTNETSSLAQRITDVNSSFETEISNTYAAIQREETARTTAVESVAQRIETISAEFQSDIAAVDAKITEESTARANEQEAIAQQVTNLTATFNQSTAQFTDQITVQANDTLALAERITSLTAEVGNNTAAIIEEQTARVDQNSAMVTTFDALTVEVQNNSAEITTEKIARVDADSALARTITTVRATAEFKNRTYSQDTEPTQPVEEDPDNGIFFIREGDLWIDTDDNNKVYRWNGTSWNVVSDTAALNAFISDTYTTDIGDLQGLIDQKIETWFQTGDPSTAWTTDELKLQHDGDLWYDTDDKIFYRYKRTGTNTGEWQTIEDITAINAAAAASAAQSTADGKIVTFAQASQPTAEGTGDLWIDTDDDNKLYRWTGTAWLLVDDARISRNTAAIIAEEAARIEDDIAIANSITTLESIITNFNGQSEFKEEWEHPEAISNWQNYNGSGELVLYDVTDSSSGSKVLRVGNNSGNDQAWLIYKQNIPYDPSKLYKTTVRIRRLQGTGVAYLGFAGVLADGVTLCNINGANSSSYQHYHVASGVSPNTTWTTYYGYTSGLATQGGGANNDADNPSPMQTNVRYIRPLILVNYSGQPGIYEIDDFVVDDYTDVNENRVTIDITAETVNGLGGKYGVKIDNNGNVSGFGIISDANNAEPFSEFKIAANRFSIGPPVGTDENVDSPFYVVTEEYTDSVTGRVITPGVYIKSAKVGTLTANQIDTRGLSIKDASGNVIFAAGTALDWDNISSSYPSGIDNTSISISSNGTLSGAGGGSVTIGGLGYTGALDANKTSVDANGAIQGVSSGAGTLVSNTLVDTLSFITTNVTAYNNTIKKTGGTNGSWDAQAYSKESYTTGAYVSFSPDQANLSFMAGLNTDPATNASYTSLDYAWYALSNGTLRIYESSANRGDIGPYVAGDILSITYDGTNVRYYQNGVLKRTVAATITNPLYFDSSLASTNVVISKIKFGPMSSNNWAQIGGADKPEDNATVGADATNLKVGTANNMVFNGSYRDGLLGTAVGWRSAGDLPILGRNLSTSYQLTGTDGLAYIRQTGTVASGTTFDANVYGNGFNTRFNVFAGARYQAYAWFNTHRCTGTVKIAFYDSNGTYISETGGNTVSYQSGVTKMSDLRQSVVFATAPATATTAVILLRATTTGSADPYLFFTRVFFGEAGAAQTDPSPWPGSGGLLEITTSNASTYIADAAIGNALIANLSADKIDAGFISAARIEGNSITADKINSTNLTIRDSEGTIIFGAGTSLDWDNISSTYPSGIDNTSISISSSGVLSGAGGGTVSLTGLGAKAFATLDKITSSNVSTYIGSAAIGEAYIGDLSASKITSGFISADRIAADTITASMIDVTELSAISADLGTITAGSIDAGLIKTGALSADRIDSRNLSIKDSAGTVIFSAGTNLDWARISTTYPDAVANLGVNYATSELWTYSATNTNALGKFGGDFIVNGDGNQRIYDTDPFGKNGWIWRSYNNDTIDDADGGWNKTITGLVSNKGYVSFVFFKVVTTGNGDLYFGCDQSNTLNLNGTANPNPYFGVQGTSAFEVGEWYLAYGIIQPYTATTATNSGVGGIYRLRDGQKVQTFDDFKMKDGATVQTQRVYLYYSTNPNTNIYWSHPGFYKMDGSEPSYSDLLTKGMVGAVSITNKLTDTNVSSYIESAAIGEAYIGELSVSKIKSNSSGTYNGGTFALGVGTGVYGYTSTSYVSQSQNDKAAFNAEHVGSSSTATSHIAGIFSTASQQSPALIAVNMVDRLLNSVRTLVAIGYGATGISAHYGVNINTTGESKFSAAVFNSGAVAETVNGTRIYLGYIDYAAYVAAGDGSIYAPDGFGPFTGYHEGLVPEDNNIEIGDIVFDVKSYQLIDVSTVTFYMDLTDQDNQKGVIGICSKIHNDVPGNWLTPVEPSSLNSNEELEQKSLVPEGYKVINVNAVGEGQINVCGLNGNIEKGDLIVASSMPGKGMRQDDDIIRSYTVAKARISVTFDDPNEVKMIPCVYLCG